VTLFCALRKRRRRLRLAWLTLLALLFQQVALASYVCPNAETPTQTVSMAGCEGMEMPDPDAPALCHQHCVRDHVTSPDLKAPQLPMLALPPLHFAMVLLPPVEALHYQDVPTCRSDPPPAQRFCSLQI
jgi:hypothetical protein